LRSNTLRIALTAVFILAAASAGLAAMGEIQSIVFNGFLEDVLGPGESAVPDGKPDAVFTVNISGAGAISGFTIQSEDGKSAWDTTAGNRIPGIRVQDASGRVIVESNGTMTMTVFILATGIKLTVHDDGSIARGGRFTVTAHFMDGSHSRGTVDIPPSVIPDKTTIQILSARWTGQGTRDITGPNEQMHGDGVLDRSARVSLRGKGVLTGVTVRSVEGEKAEWDTLPGNSAWLVAVRMGNKVLNKSDGTVEAPLDGESDLELLLTDTGALARGRSRFEAVLVFSDGTVLTKEIERETDTPAEDEDLFAGSAVLTGVGNRDLVGRNENRQGNGKPDWKIDLKVETPGTISGIIITNTSGPAGTWDTIPGNGHWLVAVTDANGNILNRNDGSVHVPIPRPTELQLWIEDNDSLGDERTRSRVTLVFDDGRNLSREIENQNEPEEIIVRPERPRRREISLSSPRQATRSDYVGPGETPGKSGKNDWVFELQIKGRGDATAVILEAVGTSVAWDTVPGNRRWLVGVVAPGKGLLNDSDGSVSFKAPPQNKLQLFVEDRNRILERGRTSKYQVTVQWSDGTESTATN